MTDKKYISWNQDYVSEFLSLKCSGDVLNVCSPLGAKAKKEITESMGAIKELRKIVLKEPMKYYIYDLCAGNALTSVLAVHLLPIRFAIAIDKRERKRDWHNARRFEYHFEDIYQISPERFAKDTIILSIHPCRKLAERVVWLYNNSEASHLILIPCCNGAIKSPAPQNILKLIGKYTMWCWQLADECNGKFKMDDKIISPKNIIIVASKN